MLGLQYTKKALDHWQEWRPKMVAEMRAAGTLNHHVQQASKEAARQVADLMAAGLQKHEAEEFVLHELILLPPEPKTAKPLPPKAYPRLKALGGARQAEKPHPASTRVGAVQSEVPHPLLEQPTPEMNALASAPVPAVLGAKPSPVLGLEVRNAVSKAEFAAAIKAAGKRLNSGIDPTVLASGLKLSAIYIEEGVMKFAAWAKAIIDDMREMGIEPDLVKPNLKEIYLASQAQVDDAQLDQMDDTRTVRAFDIAALDEASG